MTNGNSNNNDRFFYKLKAAEHPVIVPLPEMERGDYRIVHRTIPGNMPIRTMSNGYVQVDADIIVRILEHKGQLWMSDTPSEIEDMQQMATSVQKKHTHVLIAGLGMGILTTLVAQKENVQKVTVIEISPEVVEMVSPYLPDKEKVEIIVDDFREWIKQQEQSDLRQYDAVLLDIWGDISLDDLSDMVSLWVQSGAEHGAIWGVEVLADRLLNEIIGAVNSGGGHEEVACLLEAYGDGLTDVAAYIREYCSGDEWYDEVDFDDLDSYYCEYDQRYDGEEAVREAFENVHGLTVW